MEEIDLTFSKIISELTFSPIESLREMKDGYLVAELLSQLSSASVNETAKFESWTDAKIALEAYLSDKGLNNQMLDIDVSLITNGTLEHLISAVLQIFAIIAVFNHEEWNAVLDKLDENHKNLILPIIDPLISDIHDEINQISQHDDVRQLLLKLERQHSEINELRHSVEEKTQNIQRKAKEIEKLNLNNKNLSNELKELQKNKNETIQQLEDFYSSKNKGFDDEELSKRLNRIVSERDDIADKLFRVQLIVVDKDNEIEKLTLIKDAYEAKHMETDGYNEQIEYYKSLIEKMKTDLDVKDSKIKMLEVAEEKVTRLRDKVREQSTQLGSLRLENIDLENKLKTVERKLKAADEKVDLLKKKNSGLFEPNRDLFSESTQMARLEDENDDLKRKISTLIDKLGETEIDKLDAEMIERSNQLLKGKVKSLLLLNDTMGGTQSPYFESSKITHSHVVYGTQFHPIEEESREGLFGLTSTLKELQSDQSIIEKAYYDQENVDILYSVCMEYVRKDIMKTRMLMPTRADRKRDIFKMFSLTDMIGDKSS